jgi:hypothetical protein
MLGPCCRSLISRRLLSVLLLVALLVGSLSGNGCLAACVCVALVSAIWWNFSWLTFDQLLH